MAAITPRYDPERFGIKLVGSPRHADVLVVNGPVVKMMKDRLLRVYEQMPDPKVVMNVRTCGISGGVYYDSYNLEGPVDEVVPVDVYVPGCPPRPEAIIHGVVKTWAKLESLEGGGFARFLFPSTPTLNFALAHATKKEVVRARSQHAHRPQN